MEDAPPSLDEVNRRLAEIDGLLESSHRDPSPEHFALLVERDHLRAVASDHRLEPDAGRTDEALRAELAGLTKRLAAETKSRTGYVISKGGNNAGPAAGAWVELAAKSRAGGSIDQLITRISAIEAELERRSS